MLSSSLYTMLKMSKTTYPNKLFDYDCVTLYVFSKAIIILIQVQTKYHPSSAGRVMSSSPLSSTASRTGPSPYSIPLIYLDCMEQTILVLLYKSRILPFRENRTRAILTPTKHRFKAELRQQVFSLLSWLL